MSTFLIGVAAGGAWNAANLWSLARLLQAWLISPRSLRRVIGWLVVKFPLLYVLAFLALRSAKISVIGFSIGFTVVLLAAVGHFLLRAARVAVPSAHGR